MIRDGDGMHGWFSGHGQWEASAGRFPAIIATGKQEEEDHDDGSLASHLPICQGRTFYLAQLEQRTICRTSSTGYSHHLR